MRDFHKIGRASCTMLLLAAGTALAQGPLAGVDGAALACEAPTIPGSGSVTAWDLLTGPVDVDYAPPGSASTDPTQFEYLFGGVTAPLKAWPGAYGVVAAFALPVDRYASIGFVATPPYLASAATTLYGGYSIESSGNEAPLSMTISTSCGDFGQMSPSTIVPGCVFEAAMSGTLTWRAPTAAGTCRLQDGRQYFLNLIDADISALDQPGGTAVTTSNANCTGGACVVAVTNGPGNWQAYLPTPGDAIFANSFDYRPEGGEPRADFAYTTSGPTFTFTDRSSDSGGIVSIWQWSFGDGATSGLRNPVHAYAAGGYYTVKLTVTDDVSGLSSIVLRQVYVDNVPPSVSVDESGEHGTITLLAAATDDIGIAKVEFYIDDVLKGTDTSVPYLVSFNSTTIADGSHQLVAKAYDTAGNIGTSSPRQFSIDNTPPTVAAAESGTSGTITLTAVASDGIGVTRVEFYIDGALKDTDYYAPYSVSFNSVTLPNGSHELVAKAYDAVGNVGTSNAFAFTTNNPDTTPPQVTAQAAVDGGTVTLSATATDLNGIERVEFYVDNVLKGTDSTAPYAITLGTATLTSGSHVLVAKAYDPSQNVGTSFQTSFYTTAPPTPDNFALAAPATVQIGMQFQVTFTVQGASNCVGSATLDGNAISLPGWTTNTAPYSPRIVTANVVGTYTLGMTCSNSAGSVSSQPATVIVTPAVTAYASESSGFVALSATVTGAAGVTKVEFYVDNVLKGQDATSPYGINVNSATLTTGEHALVAKAYAGTTLIGTSPPYMFYVFH